MATLSLALIKDIRKTLRDMGHKCSRDNIRKLWVIYRLYMTPVKAKRTVALQEANASLEEKIKPMMEDLHKQLTPSGYQLYEHQKFGVRFMLSNELSRNTGGILADDMGLGKTLQSLSTTLANPGHTLMVVPTCVLSQWEEAALQLIGHKFIVMIHHGIKRDLNLDFTEAQKEAERADKHLFVITSHRLMFKGIKGIFVKTQFHKAQWYRMIVDEAHVARNPKSKVYSGIYHIKAKYKWMVTGTPVGDGTGI